MKTFNSLFPITPAPANPSNHYMIRYDKVGTLSIEKFVTDPTPIQGTVWNEVWNMAGNHISVDASTVYDPDDSRDALKLKLTSITTPIFLESNSIMSAVKRACMNLVCSLTMASYLQELQDSNVIALRFDIVISAECTDRQGMLVCASSVHSVDVPAQFASYDGEVYKAADDMSSEYITTIEFSDSTIALLRSCASHFAQQKFHIIDIIA